MGTTSGHGSSLSGGYWEMLVAIPLTSSAARGGLQRTLFSVCKAISIASGDMPRRRIEPAKLASVSLRAPASITPLDEDSGSFFRSTAFGAEIGRTILAKSQSGAARIGVLEPPFDHR